MNQVTETRRKVAPDAWAALVVAQVITLFVADPWWKALFIVPMMLIVAMPFWLIERAMTRREAAGKAGCILLIPALAYFVAALYVGWRIFKYRQGI